MIIDLEDLSGIPNELTKQLRKFDNIFIKSEFLENYENNEKINSLIIQINDYCLVNETYHILISEKLKKKKEADYYGKFFAPIENQLIISPQKYFPKKEFIQFHLDEIFDKK